MQFDSAHSATVAPQGGGRSREGSKESEDSKDRSGSRCSRRNFCRQPRYGRSCSEDSEGRASSENSEGAKESEGSEGSAGSAKKA